MAVTIRSLIFKSALCAAFSVALAPSVVCGWGGPHTVITQAAAAALPEWQKQLLGAELKPLGERYCLIPDTIHTDKENARFATMESYPGVCYLRILHLPATPAENDDVLRYYIGKAVAAFAAGQVGEAARYAGTLSHALEDWGCPAHVVPGDNMFTLFKQFLPPPASHQHALLHGPVENGVFELDLGGYRPQLLGTSVDEAAFNLLRRVQGATVHARSQVVPIIQALYAGDTNAVNAAQQVAAGYDAKVVADALYTLGCLMRKRFDEPAALEAADLTAWAPLEFPDLYPPQAAFFSKPFWGHTTFGVILNNGKPVPLQLNVAEQGQTVTRTFASGIGTGTRSVVTYRIPEGVYARFTAWAGLQAGLGRSGQVTFSVSGNGKPLATLGPVVGDVAARAVDVPLAGVTNLQLTVSSAGGDGSGNFAVWGEPRLRKAPGRADARPSRAFAPSTHQTRAPRQ